MAGWLEGASYLDAGSLGWHVGDHDIVLKHVFLAVAHRGRAFDANLLAEPVRHFVGFLWVTGQPAIAKALVTNHVTFRTRIQ